MRQGANMEIMATELGFPEGPIAMADGSVLLVEIQRECLSRVHLDKRVEVVAKIGGGPNGAAMGPDGNVFICNNGGFNWVRRGDGWWPHGQASDYTTGRIEVVDTRTGRVERLYDQCDGHRLNGPNDLVFDNSGGFWFTDLGKRRDRDMDRGYVYWARADGSEIREVIAAMATPNGIGLSPDGKTLYVAETDTGRLWAFDVIGPGELRKREGVLPYGGRLVTGLGGYRRFDSLAVAASGNICVGGVDNGCIVEISPDGSLVRDHPAPDLLTTNLCFGGDDMRTAFVTLSHSGRLGMIRWHEPGLRLNHQC
jgi:gluconolactonase